MRASGTAAQIQAHFHESSPQTRWWPGSKDAQGFGTLLSDAVGLWKGPAATAKATGGLPAPAQATASPAEAEPNTAAPASDTAPPATQAAQAQASAPSTDQTTVSCAARPGAAPWESFRHWKGSSTPTKTGAVTASPTPVAAPAPATAWVDPLAAKIAEWSTDPIIQGKIATILASDNAVVLGITGYTTAYLAQHFTLAGLEMLYDASSWKNTTGIPPGDPNAGNEPMDVQPGPAPFKS